MTVWLSLAINLVAVAIAVIVMRRMIDRRAGSASVMEEIRREVGAILTEMNQTTERNIELVEDRIQRLQEIVERADKRLGTLRREVEKHERAGAVYSHLSRASTVAAGSDDSGVVPEEDSNVHVSPLPSQPGSDQRSAVARREPVPGGSTAAVGSAGVAASPRASAPSGSVPPGSAATDLSAKVSVPPSTAPQSDSAEGAQIGDEPSLKERVMGLYRQGIPVERIASRVGTAVSEIELIVSLGER